MRLITQIPDFDRDYSFLMKENYTPMQNYLVILNFINTGKVSYAFHDFSIDLLEFVHFVFELDEPIPELNKYFNCISGKIVAGTLGYFFKAIIAPANSELQVRLFLNEVHMFFLKQGLTGLFTRYGKKVLNDGSYIYIQR